MTRTPADGYANAFHNPRHLNEDVLQTAEEAVLANPASVESMSPQAGMYTDIDAPGPHRARHALAGYVAEKPCRSALMAMVVGGVVAAVLRSTLAHRRLRPFRRST